MPLPPMDGAQRGRLYKLQKRASPAGRKPADGAHTRRRSMVACGAIAPPWKPNTFGRCRRPFVVSIRRTVGCDVCSNDIFLQA